MSFVFPPATQTDDGLMSASDKTKLDSNVPLKNAGNSFTASQTFIGTITGGTNFATLPVTLDLSSTVGAAFSDFVYPNGGRARLAEIGIAGTNDVFFQAFPPTTAGYGYLEAWASAGLIIGTGQNANPVIVKPGRTEVARFTASGLETIGTGSFSGNVIAPTFQLSSTGPKAKNSSGVFEIRNSADSAYANLRANLFTAQTGGFLETNTGNIGIGGNDLTIGTNGGLRFTTSASYGGTVDVQIRRSGADTLKIVRGDGTTLASLQAAAATFSGSVAGTGFVGDGSQLTNLPAASTPTANLLVKWDGDARVSNLVVQDSFTVYSTVDDFNLLTVDQGNTTVRFGDMDGCALICTDKPGGAAANAVDDTQCWIYLKSGKLIIQYSEAGTYRYKYLDLTGTGVTWAHSTTEP